MPPTTSGGWKLGIDFGTSYTVAAVATSSGVSVLDVESNGQSRMPSSVFLTADGEILVGTAAQHQAVFAPERFEATPKRCLADGELFLGDRMIAVTELIAAILRRVFTEACRQQGETLPAQIRMTHPADWGTARLALLTEAAQRAGLPVVTFVAEPVAAAVWIADTTTQVGDRIAVYDFGGGTFDAAVLRRDVAGYKVAGPPIGRDPLGGEDIDQHIIDYIGTVLDQDAQQAWASLRKPPDVAWRRRSAALRMEVQRAKETLSEVNSCLLWLPGLERELQLTRAELERLIATDVDACTDTLLTAMTDAAVAPKDLTGLYLVGGSSRIPLVAETLWRRLGIRPLVQDSPKSVVALGAARGMAEDRAAPLAEVAAERRVVTVKDSSASLLLEHPDTAGDIYLPPTMMLTIPPGFSSQASAYVTLDRPNGRPATIRIRNEACDLNTAKELAIRIGAFRAARSTDYVEESLAPSNVLGAPGMKRHFMMTSGTSRWAMTELYLAAAGRAFVMAYPTELNALAATFTLTHWPTQPDWIASPVTIPRPQGWTSNEQIVLRGSGNTPQLVAERIELPGEPVQAWRWHRLESLLRSMPQSGVVNRTAGDVLNGVPGDIVTVRWSDGQIPMLTKLGTAATSGHGFMITLTLPLADQANFPRLAAMIDAHPLVKIQLRP